MSKDTSAREDRSHGAVAKSAAHLRALMGATDDAIITLDSASRIIGMNAATESLFGYRPAELLGMDISVLLPLPEREDDDAFLARYLEREDTSLLGIGRELTAHRKDGSNFPVDLSIDELGTSGEFVAIIRDISERRKLEQDVVNAAEDERIAVARELHDGVGSLLTAIKFRTEAVAKAWRRTGRADPAEIETIVDLVQESITQVRAISRGLHPIGAHPDDLLAALCSLAARADRGPELHCRLHCPEPLVLADQTAANHLFRIAEEAVSNALKHSHATQIDLSLVRTGENIALIIADNGDGIPPGLPTTDGLGLMTMRFRANAINGTLTIEPRRNQGTKVTCLLPFVSPPNGSDASLSR